MKIPEKYLSAYNLRQACLFIAFHYKTMEAPYEEMHTQMNKRLPPLCVSNYSEFAKYMESAKSLLYIALMNGTIKANGCKESNAKEVRTLQIQLARSVLLSHSDDTSEIRNKIAKKKLVSKPIIITPDSELTLFMEPRDELIDDVVCDNNRYTDIQIDYSALEKAFPKPLYPHQSRYNTDYSTPYIDIIFELIAEQDITESNQGKALTLAMAANEKLKEKGLPQSDNISRAIATIVRLPKSQNGGAHRQKK